MSEQQNQHHILFRLGRIEQQLEDVLALLRRINGQMPEAPKEPQRELGH